MRPVSPSRRQPKPRASGTAVDGDDLHMWTSNGSTPNPTLTEVFTSGELTEVFGFASLWGTPPTVAFCYYGEPLHLGDHWTGRELVLGHRPRLRTTTYTYDSTISNRPAKTTCCPATDPDGGSFTNTYNLSGQISHSRPTPVA